MNRKSTQPDVEVVRLDGWYDGGSGEKSEVV